MSCLLLNLSQPATPSDSTARPAATIRRTVRPLPVRFPVIARSLLSVSRRFAPPHHARAGGDDPPTRSSPAGEISRHRPFTPFGLPPLRAHLRPLRWTA